MKKIFIILLAVVLVIAAVAGILLWSFNSKYISHKEAVQVALEDAGLSFSDIRDVDAEFEKTRYDAWYEVDFETHGMEYKYSIDAENGDILSSHSKPER